MQSVDDFVNQILGESYFKSNISICKTKRQREATTTPIPDYIHPALKFGLQSEGISDLYSHQEESIAICRDGKNVVIVTGTASGKSLCYNIPVLNDILITENIRALYLFPTKALAHDQYQGVLNLSQQILTYSKDKSLPERTLIATYDGDTPRKKRRMIRNESLILITNPDMLHIGILPHHTQWSQFMKELRYVVIDEIHTYRGVFGSHVCNVLRRLKRIAQFYGAELQFIMTSATIGNPGELAERLTETKVDVIDEDGSPHGEKYFIIYNPPIINPELNLRANYFYETKKLARKLYQNRVQTIVFSQTRRSVELLLLLLQNDFKDPEQIFPYIKSYRSGYLPERRRELEKGLKNGDIGIIIATNALELGIDCGQMGAVILNGFPGTISATWQQAGRAGRKSGSSVAILVTSSNPIDQFFSRNPDFFLNQNPEKGLINPNNALILLDHIKCACYELPFSQEQGFGLLPSDELHEYLSFLEKAGILYESNNAYFWSSTGYPADGVSLRNASATRYALVLINEDKENIIGEIDQESVYWMVHPEAIYLHEGNTYIVDKLDTKSHLVMLRAINSDYYTRPNQERDYQIIREIKREITAGGVKLYTELLIREQVVGYERILFESNEIIHTKPLSLPKTEFITTGYLFSINDEIITLLKECGEWTNDPVDYGPEWKKQRLEVLDRDGYICQNCGMKIDRSVLHVHHKVPLRLFKNRVDANKMDNLIALCMSCHKRAEDIVRVRSGLAGLAYLIGNLSPLFLMCDKRDIGVHFDFQSHLNKSDATLLLFDRISGGLGFSQEVFIAHDLILGKGYELVIGCNCKDGCPACVGPGGEFGMGSKRETLALLKAVLGF